ncbi:MAG TPA: AraC family transcriptional regulator [Chitinophagaceae bacterium]|jgi:AraC-like DNA-binding protein|nr:AraC family transcriptional regulator [Chitinophagaceae bacterium]
MKPILSKVNAPTENLISIVERCEPYFKNVFHFHEECELVYVTESHGKRIIGNDIQYFDKGDIVFLGANLPHVWYNDKEYFAPDSSLKARSIVVYFPQDVFGNKFFALEETRQLTDFFQRARRGIKVIGPAQKRIAREMKSLLQKKGLDVIIGLLDILQILSETTDFHYLANPGYSHAYNQKDNHKIDRVFRFVINNYHRNISLDEVAALTQLTPQSFCRFFKNRTRKSFIEFVNEVRIGQACKKLAEEEWTVAEIAYACGFSNLSNFNRFFKNYTGKTPRVYRQEILMQKE